MSREKMKKTREKMERECGVCFNYEGYAQLLADPSVDAVAVGEIIVIRPGARSPLDGRVVSGACDINTLALTGEAEPRSVRVGDRVLCGCNCLTGELRVLVDTPFEKTAFSALSLLIYTISH